jgi:hypothetical protein
MVLSRQSIYGALLIVLIYLLLHYFEILTSKYWESYPIGVLLALAAVYFTANTKVRVEIEQGRLTVYHGGMVHADTGIDSIAEVSVSGNGNLARIVVLTDDGLKIYIPSGCFSAAEVEELKSALRNN